jgi:very-short-patch-repair endonuclease
VSANATLHVFPGIGLPSLLSTFSFYRDTVTLPTFFHGPTAENFLGHDCPREPRASQHQELALNQRDIHIELEFGDGNKRVDISIPSARLNIELDGKYHLTDPEHLFRDLERDSYSHSDGTDTTRVPNFYVDKRLDEVADSIAEVAKRRSKK